MHTAELIHAISQKLDRLYREASVEERLVLATVMNELFDLFHRADQLETETPVDPSLFSGLSPLVQRLTTDAISKSKQPVTFIEYHTLDSFINTPKPLEFIT